ncbi:acylphosphatase [Saccharicrinis sp. FJH54]|uniref:acylphosphatase n=1 Tax=Saccharicrinis sp. FJH54 TaxID=3344665 RepID=UPI0035D44FBC
MNKHLKITISGEVQGVGFRMHARSVAHDLSICGFIKNQPDETVFIEAEGSNHQLLQFTNWCRTGPAHATVEDVSIEETSWVGFKSFEIRR